MPGQKKGDLPDDVKASIARAKEVEEIYRSIAKLSKDMCLKLQDLTESGTELAEAIIDLGLSDSGTLARACVKLGEAERGSELVRGGLVSNLVDDVHRPAMTMGEARMAEVDELKIEYKALVKGKSGAKEGEEGGGDGAEAKLAEIREKLASFDDVKPLHKCIELLAKETKIFFDSSLQEMEGLDEAFD
uniref:Uncharacterized protein n=1 Tax=Palpitomonas bilix TaxID=652834 RepID=A0A7S3DBY7_9EUKA|mmetsp:Transcript_31005/g.81415  ORF Transcript_31005/g.81415 Transcript_31005/m.81415 type:complete len:189 (+) Transcript_31005:255-821(+)